MTTPDSPTCDVCAGPVYPMAGQTTADTVVCEFCINKATNPGTVTVTKDGAGGETLEWVDAPPGYYP